MTASETFKLSVYTPRAADVQLELVTISHSDLSATLRFVDNTADVLSAGSLFTALPMNVRLPREVESGSVSGSLRIDDVSRSTARALRALSTPPDVRIDIVLAATPHQIEVSYTRLQLNDLSVDASTVSGSLGRDDLRSEPFPTHSLGPTYFPELF